MLKGLSISILASLLFIGCTATEIELDPVRMLKKKLKDQHAYTITISDMDLVQDQFKHKYKIFKIEKNHTVVIDSTGWQNVTDDFFNYHKNDLGMEVTSKLVDGHINDLPTPPGYTNFIGNENFGHWETDSVPAYWQFESQYGYLITQLNLQNIKVLKSEYDIFNSEYQFNRPYYGSNTSGTTRYGTRSSSMRNIYPLFYLRRSSNRNFTKPKSSSRSGGSRGGGGYGK